jgi:hypothetical protein
MKKKILIVLLFTILKVEAQTSTFSVSDSLFAKGSDNTLCQLIKPFTIQTKLVRSRIKQIKKECFLR